MTHDELLSRAEALISGEVNPLANAANISALIFNSMERLNWAGFYFLDGGELVLGPFQGKPACIRIRLGRGVCGTALVRGETMRVPDVHLFPGHIACDEASRSEIVIPIFVSGRAVGVLDLDSPFIDRFSDLDQTALEGVVRSLERACDWSRVGYSLG